MSEIITEGTFQMVREGDSLTLVNVLEIQNVMRIPYGVTHVSKNAFKKDECDDDSCEEVEYICDELYVPGTIKKIEANTFSFMRVKKVIVEEGVEIIGISAFSSSFYLEEIVLPKSLKRIERTAFAYTVALKVMDLPEGLEYIGTGALMASGIEKLVIPKSVREIGALAFFSSYLHFVEFKCHPEEALRTFALIGSPDFYMFSWDEIDLYIEFKIDGEYHVVPKFLSEDIANKYNDNIDDEKILEDLTEHFMPTIDFKDIALNTAIAIFEKKGIGKKELEKHCVELVLYLLKEDKRDELFNLLNVLDFPAEKAKEMMDIAVEHECGVEICSVILEKGKNALGKNFDV